MGAAQTPGVGGGGGSGSSYRTLIEARVLPGNSPTISFASITQIYRNLIIEAWLNTATAVATEVVSLTLNGQTNPAQYYIQDFGAIQGATIVGHAGTNRSIAQSIGSGGMPAFNEIRFLDYTQYPSDHAFVENRYLWSESSTKLGQIHRFLRWNRNAAITDIDLVATGNLSGRVWLYGEGEP